MELKTLKDIQFKMFPFVGKELFEEELKQEAIKWVKQLTIEIQEQNYCYHHISWIKNFFNLTEEELK